MYMYNRMTLLRSIALLILHVVILSNFCTAFVIRSSSALHYYNSYKYSHSHYRKREQLVCHKYKVHFCRHVYQRNVLYLSKEKDDENEVSSFSIDLEEGDMFGPLLPLAQKINNATGGWGVSYADLAPETPETPAGQAFLITNAFYAIAGLILTLKGEILLGILTEVAGVVSFIYHYSQLKFGQNRNEVRLALVIDYITAGMALITGAVYLTQMGIQLIPLDCIIWGILSIAALSLSWVWEFGIPYLFWHSIWHILSAYTGYLIGQAHLGP